MAPLGHGKREGPAGDKLSRSDDAGYGGRVRSGAKRNGAPREPPFRHSGGDCRSSRHRSSIRSGMTSFHRPGLILLDIGDDSLNVKGDDGLLALL